MLLMVERVQYTEVMVELLIHNHQEMVELALLTQMVVEMVEEVGGKVDQTLVAAVVVLVDILVMVVEVDIKELLKETVLFLVLMD
tara:strand:+ start:53 stop:307 length:255 start_codon:yes stop_codon:yes gene_type:complete